MIAWFAPMAVETKMGMQNGLHPKATDRERTPCNARFAGCARKNILVVAAAALVAGNIASHAQNASATQEQSVAAAGAASAAEDLSDLGAMTFTCVKAGLNAAAREAAKAPTEGSYQFAYFKIINDGHHSSYEVDFKSNYMGEPDLKYCVAIYCQQGWDPKTTAPSITPIGTAPQSEGMAGHEADCGGKQAPAKR
jgi:hypothetical protein